MVFGCLEIFKFKIFIRYFVLIWFCIFIRLKEVISKFEIKVFKDG